MTAPLATALDAPPAGRSRFTGRPVATRADGTPFWLPAAASPALPLGLDADSPTSAVEAGAGNGEGGE